MRSGRAAGTHTGTSDPCWLGPATTAFLRGRQVSLLAEGPIADTLRLELATAVGPAGAVGGDPSCEPALVLARHDLLAGAVGVTGPLRRAADAAAGLGEEGFALVGDGSTAAVVATGERGLLHGYFHLLRSAATAGSHEVLPTLETVQEPALPVRMINQWDNTSAGDHLGSVERGYAGDSIFFSDGRIVQDRRRISDYARLLASVGINAVSINNVNVHPAAVRLLTDGLPDVADVARIFRGYGIATYLSVSFASPIVLGDLPTADPGDESVVAWWAGVAEGLYREIPDFGGFVVKADSEGRPGPFDYGRDHVDGANLIAGALRPFGGRVFWRCFVYDHRQDWRDRSTDRARAAYDHFAALDGRFADNVVLQVKCGPMDFQVREPVSPLALAMAETNTVVEFQITQEYTGQQIDLCCLLPQWHEILTFDVSGEQLPGDTLASALARRGRVTASSGVCAVSNVGDDANWTGHKLAQANLYGFGRVAWDPALSAREVLGEWTALTFPDATDLHETLIELQMGSWGTYEMYTAPLGVGWMVTPHTHYGPAVDGYEYSKWGTYHFADRDGLGVDRTVATGTGFAGQYPKAWAERYEHVETCPDELLLFFHHVPYSHLLHSGTTVIQHIYDTHVEGARRVVEMRDLWRSLEGRLDEASWTNVMERLERQVNSAREWRDQVTTYFFRKSGVPDRNGRVVH
ncbi:alpha-glucuronidase [Pseudonocardia alaniniphila]|uniref:Alpha-glucuronidase n=1 Tax=Pseudonocardia alaniniphila TaxID=75291 RepID=A0ABS9TUJ0_9PSEU|nr:alpha-glucuronidase [Pseudonocardia alaniniphila]MCH6172225.1 alpha-glucuronidase [Pseudonocardia alaniniphila]